MRGLERLDGDRRRVDGPSTCVDHLLALTGHGGVASLAGSFDRAVDPPAAGASPLFATVEAASRGLAVYATPRVGLSLKRGVTPGRLRFLARPYRFLTGPARVRKGRAHLVVSLHRAGHGAAVIAALTGVRLGLAARCAAMYEAGRAMDPSTFARDAVVGRGPAVMALYQQIARAATSLAPVLLRGETGAGKEWVGRAIHHHGPRAQPVRLAEELDRVAAFVGSL